MTRVLWLLLGLGLLVGIAVAVRVGTRSPTVRVERGPVGERIAARAAVVPTAGVLHVYAGNDGRVVRVLLRAGDPVLSGQTLAELESDGRTRTVTAPIGGIVLERHTEAGDYARSAEHGALMPLFVLADPTKTELRIEVEEAEATRLQLSQTLSVRAFGDAKASAKGSIERVSAQLEPRGIGVQDARLRAGGLVRVAYASWDGDKLGWPLGARAEALIELGRRDLVARLPRDALSVREGKTIVQRPDALGLWSKEADVNVVRVDPVFAEIQGLPVGSEVIVPGS